jgi:hypothetical protein
MLRFTNVETNEAMMSGQVVTQTIHWASRIPMVEDKEKSKVVGKVRWTTLPFAGWAPTRKVGLAVNDGWSLAVTKASKHQREAFDLPSGASPRTSRRRSSTTSRFRQHAGRCSKIQRYTRSTSGFRS